MTPGHRPMPVGHSPHAHMVEDYRRRFWISLALTIPVLALTPVIQRFVTGREWLFPGESYVQLAFASVVYFYGGWPFLKGIAEELRARRPGMMTLIALAISVAYVYSALVTLGLPGSVFFWETATLIDIMLLGHWIEMRSVMGASRALEMLVALMPSDAHRLKADGTTEDVPLAELRLADRVLVKPGEKVPIDGRVVEGRTTVNQAMLTGESRLFSRAGHLDPQRSGAVHRSRDHLAFRSFRDRPRFPGDHRLVYVA